MLFLLYFGRKRSWKRDILGRAGYICRMRKKLLFLMAGAASVAGPVQAQFNTVSTVPFRYRVEVVSAGRDNAVTLPGYTLSVQDTLPPSGDAAPALSADTCKHVWIERYLSVSYPLRRMKINSLYGYRKDPFTGKRKFHNGIDLHARGDEVMAMMAGVVVKVGQDKSSGKYVTLRHGNYTVSYCHLSRILTRKGAAIGPRDVVGITGSTGRSTGEHLHISCKLDGKSVDPLMVLDYIKSIREECVAALAESRETSSLSLADEKYRKFSFIFVNYFMEMVRKGGYAYPMESKIKA